MQKAILLLLVLFVGTCFAQSNYTKLEWALQYKGGVFQTNYTDITIAFGKATSEILQTLIDSKDGIKFTVNNLIGNTATFWSEVKMVNQYQFVERGNISFGEGPYKFHSLLFESLENGYLLPSPVSGNTHGLALLNITGGLGKFENALGYITSNFVIQSDGKFIEDQFAIAWVDH